MFPTPTDPIAGRSLPEPETELQADAEHGSPDIRSASLSASASLSVCVCVCGTGHDPRRVWDQVNSITTEVRMENVPIFLCYSSPLPLSSQVLHHCHPNLIKQTKKFSSSPRCVSHMIVM